MIELKLDKSEFELVYKHINERYELIKFDEDMDNDTWHPNYKRLITKLKNKMDMIK